MSRLRILHIVAGLDIGHAFGGAERSGLELARHLDRDQFDVTVCAFWQTGSTTELRWLDTLRSDKIPAFFATQPHERRESSDYFKGMLRVARWCRANPVDIVHAHHEGGALAGLMAKGRGGAKAVVRTTHVPVSKEWGDGMVGTVLRAAFTHAVFPLALDAEASISTERCRLLDQRPIAQMSWRRAHLVYNARPLAAQPVRPRDWSDAYIGSIGRLSDEKGHRFLIQAMPDVLRVCPRAYLVLVGDGALRTALQAQVAQLGIGHAVEFAGQQDDVSPHLEKLSVFVLPSLWEGLPTVLLEAIAAGVPVVASDLPGVREVVNEDAAWLPHAGNAGALARAIIAALSQPDEALARARRAQAALPRFSMSASASAYEVLYQQVLGSRA